MNNKVHPVSRYPAGTPLWQQLMDYYEVVAKDAEAIGKRLKAARYRKKAKRIFLKVGGIVIRC